MSGTFEHISVPPTLVAFGITTVKASKVISAEFKQAGHFIYLFKHEALKNFMPDTDALKKLWASVETAIEDGKVVSAYAVGNGGVAEALAKMSFGNALGAEVKVSEADLFSYGYGSIVVEANTELEGAELLGKVVAEPTLTVNGESMTLESLEKPYLSRHHKIYAQTAAADTPLEAPKCLIDPKPKTLKYKGEPIQTPLVYIPVFPGTNCDYDTAKAFRKAGAEVRLGVFCNQNSDDVLDSVARMKKEIDGCNILALAGGFSSGDEPDGSAKFIADVLTNKDIAEAIQALLKRGGLILGICNGFQALVKSGLLPYGHSNSLSVESPTLFRNNINRHISQMVTTVVESNDSPWLAGFQKGDLHSIAVSHGEGKFTVSAELAAQLFANHQVAFRYADPETGAPTMQSPANPNGSNYAIEGIISPDGQILGKMGHSERYEDNVFKNISGNCRQTIFENAVKYFRGE